MANIKVKLVRVKSTRRIPQSILQKIIEEIGCMLDRKEHGLVNSKHTEGALIRDNGIYCVTIKTRFWLSQKKHGILFHATIMLHHVRRRIGKLIARIPMELIKATFVVEPFPMINPAFN